MIEESFSKKLENTNSSNDALTSNQITGTSNNASSNKTRFGEGDRTSQRMRISAARANALSSELQDIESQVESLMSQLNNLHERIYPSPLNEIVKILNMHQLTLQSIEGEAQRLMEKISVAEDCLVRR